jgi:hypothetical protein
MMPRTLLRVAAIVAMVLGALAAPAGAADPARTPITIEDLYRFDHPRALGMAPDGRRAVYERVWLEAGPKRERHALWRTDGRPDSARPLEADQPDGRASVILPDGRWVVFLSTRPRPDGWKQTPAVPPESEAATDLWLVPTDGGTALRGAILPRCGRYAEAVQSLAPYKNNPFGSHAEVLYLALAEQAKGQTVNAKKRLQQAARWLDTPSRNNPARTNAEQLPRTDRLMVGSHPPRD